MILDSKVFLARTGLQHDAFNRARCLVCRKAPIVLAEDGKSTKCPSCGHVIDTGTAVTYARRTHCSQCRAVSGLWGGSGLARCWACHCDWLEQGKPEQTSKSVIRVRKRVAVNTLIDRTWTVDFDALVAAYRNGR